MPQPLTEKDLPKIRKEMQKIMRKNLPFVREEVSAAEARTRIEVSLYVWLGGNRFSAGQLALASAKVEWLLLAGCTTAAVLY